MIFRSIVISQFRQFRDTLSITGLEAGLNVIAGDNEAGKSTILMAIRAAFFEKYKSSTGEHYRPYGQKVSPKVCIEFDLGDKKYVLEKTFSTLKDGGCELSCNDGGRWEGPHAEDYLQELLGFSYPGRGPTKSELQGLPGLLWVEQGHGYEEVTLNEGSRNRLHSVFDSEMTELLGGDRGETLYRKIEELRSQYFGLRDKPIGNYKTLNDELVECQETLESQESKLRSYDEKVELLETRKHRLQEFKQQQSIENASQALTRANAALVQVNELEQATQAATARVKQAQIEEKLPAAQWERRQELIGEVKTADQRASAAEETLDSSVSKLKPLKTTCEQSQQELTDNKAVRASTREALASASVMEQLKQAEARHRTQGENRDKATAADNKLRNCRTKRNQITLTAGDLDEIHTTDRDLAINRERLKTAATRLDYEIETQAQVRFCGNKITGKDSVEITESTEIKIDGVGTFVIHPGGADLTGLQEQVAELEAKLNETLASFKVETVKEAARSLRSAENLDADIRQHQATMDALAPEGLAAIKAQAEESGNRAEHLREQVSASAEQSKDPDQLRSMIAELDSAIGTLKTSLENNQAEYAAQNERVIEQRADVRTLGDRAGDLREELEASRKSTPDTKISQRLADAAAASEKITAELSVQQSALENANPDAAKAEVDRAQNLLKQSNYQFRDLERSARDLEVELNALGQNGLAEELATAEVELTNLQRQLKHMDAQAGALDLLYRTMGNALQQAKETVARPIVEKMRPYLRQLIPGANPSINEDLVLTGLQRDSNDEPFTDLSIGTREQLAVIIRLAYADLLTEKNVPVTVILDDALVNSDDDRRDRMKAILFQAARRYQILVLTCHAREYRDAGGKFVLLAEAKAQL